MSEVSVGQAIEALRVELEAAVGEGDGRRVRFGLGVVRLELTAAFTKVGSGKLGWKIIEVGGSLQDVQTQTLTVELVPQVRDEGTGEYTTDFLVSGVVQPASKRSSEATSLEGGASPESTVPGTVAESEDPNSRGEVTTDRARRQSVPPDLADG
jgi:hypothetical protein